MAKEKRNVVCTGVYVKGSVGEGANIAGGDIHINGSQKKRTTNIAGGDIHIGSVKGDVYVDGDVKIDGDMK